jgi:hypothetical protein
VLDGALADGNDFIGVTTTLVAPEFLAVSFNGSFTIRAIALALFSVSCVEIPSA